MGFQNKNLAFIGRIFIRVLGLQEVVGGSRLPELFRAGERSSNSSREQEGVG
jgi:hypothetical protein